MFMCSNKYYCFLKKNKKDVYLTLVVCVNVLVLITSGYCYKSYVIL